MERNIKQIGLINLALLFATGAVTIGLAYYTNTLAGQTAAFFFGFGFLMAGVAYFQMRLEESERLEKLEFEELARGGAQSESLFASADPDALPARASRIQFERFFVPGFTLLVFLLQAGAAYWVWTWLPKALALPLKQPAVAMSLFAVSALILFLIGKYSGGIARLQKERLLRPSASYMMLCAYLSFALAAAIAAYQMGFPKADVWLARAFAVLLGLTAIETLINLIFELYRPRTSATPNRVVYESRLIGLLGQPEGLITTAAQALDYQFGFKVSETWFYRFLERALAWLILLQLAALVLSTCVVFVSPGEQALLERFGKPLTGQQPLGPGMHFKLPWPLDIAYRYRTEQIQSFTIGVGEEEGAETAAGDDGHGHSAPKQPKHDESTILWTVGHYQNEFNLLVASRDLSGRGSATNITEQGVPVDLLSVSIPVQYQIKNVYDWAYNHTDAGKLLESTATQEVISYLMTVDLFEIMSSGRAKAALDLRERIQRRADALKLGVNILLVGLEDIHPPVKVAPEFEKVVATRQESEAVMRQAEGYAMRTVALAGSEAAKLIEDARAYRDTTVIGAQAQAARFASQIAAYKASPNVYLQRSYLNAISSGLTNARKFFIISTNTSETIQLNLEEGIKGEIFNSVDIPPARQ